MKNTNDKHAILTMLAIFAINLHLFDTVINASTSASTGNDLSPEMHTYYSDYQIDYARAALYHNQFGQEHNISKRNGKTIEFRVKKPFAKALTPLTEGVTPSGHALDWGKLDATVSQYGDFALVTDVLETTAVDSQITYATENNGVQAGETIDTITREILNGGSSVQYAEGQVLARYKLVGGDATAANNHYFTVDCVRRAVRFLKNQKAQPVSGGDYVAIAHTDTLYDLMSDSAWQNVKDYDPEDWYNGEVGRIMGCRFVETTEAKIFHAADLVAEGSTNEARTLTVASYAAKVITIDEALSSAEATALADRKIIVNGYQYTVASAAAGAAGAATITIDETPTSNPADGHVIYPGEAGAAGRDVYSTLFIGKDAYGVTKVEGLGLDFIYKPLGSGGTSDPLNQRATAGWKATHVAKRLVETYMLRVETACTFQSGAN